MPGRFLGGEAFRIWNYIPYPSSFDRDRIASMFDKVVNSAPYSDVAAQSQMKLGATREKQHDYPAAVKAYERAADRYSDRPEIAADAMYRAGMAYRKQAQTAEYDQGAAGQAIASLTDFMTLYPDDKRVPESENTITSLKSEQARGNFEIAKYYEKHKQWNGALIYYNEVLLEDPNSALAPQAGNASIPSRNVCKRRPNDMRPLRWFLIACAGFLLAGCAGYTLGPTNGETAGDKTIQISPFGNSTMEPHLGDALTDALRKQVQHDGTFRLATSEAGDIVVTGTVTGYDRREQDFSPADADVALDYRISLTAQVTARERSTGKVVLNQPRERLYAHPRGA